MRKGVTLAFLLLAGAYSIQAQISSSCTIANPLMSSSQCDAQRKKFCWTPDQVMCKYCDKIGSNCLQYSDTVCSRGFTEAEQQSMVDSANALRRKVAKGDAAPQLSAALMYELKWNDLLAEMAQTWTDHCSGPNQPHAKDANLYNIQVGQNFYAQSAQSPQGASGLPEAANKDWFSEIKYVSPEDAYKLPEDGGNFGHYSQLVWGETREVGCGYIQYLGEGGWYNQVVNCFYAPAANLPGAPIYLVGDTASKCPEGQNDGLCTWSTPLTPEWPPLPWPANGPHYCTSESGHPCLTFEQMGPGYQDDFKQGDPCFGEPGAKQCYLDKHGSLAKCNCDNKPWTPPTGPHSCTSTYGSKCLTKSEVGNVPSWFLSSFDKGDPCFQSDQLGGKYCVTEVNNYGSMQPCHCNNQPA